MHFWSIFPIWEGRGSKKVFLENLTLPHTTSSGFLTPWQKLEKTNDTVPRKSPDQRNDGQTLFYWTLPATTQGPIRYYRCQAVILKTT